MPAKSLRQQAFAPQSGSFLDAGQKARRCEGFRKSLLDFSGSLNAAANPQRRVFPAVLQFLHILFPKYP
ncbi:MAG: hypothetical protein J6J99_00270 [Oscillibacter sp.]|nr:hypothetical protein [Oscillibacter sp.]